MPDNTIDNRGNENLFTTLKKVYGDVSFEANNDENVVEPASEKVGNSLVEAYDAVLAEKEREAWEEFRKVFTTLNEASTRMTVFSNEYNEGKFLISDGLKLYTEIHNRRIADGLADEYVEPWLPMRKADPTEMVQYATYLSSVTAFFRVAEKLKKISADYDAAYSLVTDGVSKITVAYNERGYVGKVF